MKNIVLIGMPGSGKTTIAKLLKERLDKPMLDLDNCIEKYYEESIDSMFKQSEDYFRKNESFICQLFKDKEGYIISCGGGVVKRTENIQYLKENGIIYFLDRTIEHIMNDIDIEARPLLQAGEQRLFDLYQERYPLYLKAADVMIDNNASIEETLQQIIISYQKLK